MAFRLKIDESVAHGLRRLAAKQLKSARASLHSRGTTTTSPDSIHDARRGLKKARAILAVLERDDAGGIGRAGKWLRKASRALAPFRDADAALETFDRLKRRAARTVSARTLACIHARLSRQRRALEKNPDVVRDVRAAAKFIERARSSIDRWSPRHKFGAVARAVEEAFHEGREAMAAARQRGRAADFHEWRKAVKRLWYELRLVEGCGARVRTNVRDLDRLETWLGDDHNAVLLCARMLDDARTRNRCGDLIALCAVIERYQADLRAKSLALGARLYSATPRRYVEEIKQLWRRWKK